MLQGARVTFQNHFNTLERQVADQLPGPKKVCNAIFGFTELHAAMWKQKWTTVLRLHVYIGRLSPTYRYH